MGIYINIDSVKACAQDISNTNKSMLEDFAVVEKAVQRLNSQWSSNASNACSGRFGSIKNSYLDDSFKVIDNLAKFIGNNIAEQYYATELAVSKAADAFK
ncbi:MAG: hypothetical protein IKU23_03400 [Clostridia bacterium]|nr:hypothetical protein [Clostridia bacterium]